MQASNTQAALHQQQLQEVQSKLAMFNVAQQNLETEMSLGIQTMQAQMWQRIESAIKAEEDRVRAQLEAERKQREEMERKQREVEEKARQEKERQLQEELRRKKEEEERQKQKQQEEEARKQQEELAKKKGEQEKAEQEERKALGMTTASQDWKAGRDYIQVSPSARCWDTSFNRLYSGLRPSL